MAKKSKKRVEGSVQESSKQAVTRVRRAESGAANDNSMVRGIIIIVLVVLGVYLLVSAISGGEDRDNGDKAAVDETSKVEDSDKDKEDDEVELETNGPATQSSDTKLDETDSELSYSVGEGESYTTIARHAVARVGGDLTPAERVAAETRLVIDANAELLNVGQEIKLSKDTVRAAVDWAKGLSGEQKAAWQPYADMVAW